MKKFTDQLTALSTPDIRSVLRYLNNNIQKTVNATKLASMKHDLALKNIEDNYTPANIEKALDQLASGTAAKPRTAKTTPKNKPKTVPPSAAASYIIDVGGNFFVIAAGPNGACTLDDTIFASLEAAHKEWPEAIPPQAIATADDIKDMLG